MLYRLKIIGGFGSIAAVLGYAVAKDPQPSTVVVGIATGILIIWMGRMYWQPEYLRGSIPDSARATLECIRKEHSAH